LIYLKRILPVGAELCSVDKPILKLQVQMSISLFFQYFFQAFTEIVWYYVIFAIPFFLVFWVIWKKYWQPRRIQVVQRATPHHFKHDLAFSFSSFFVFAVMDVFLLYLEHKGYTQLYFKVDQYGWPWIFISLALVLFVDDAFFYWTHRAMHHPRLYKFFHKVHHESTDPSPLTAFAFHPSEAIIENAMNVVLPFIFPLHFGVVIVWQVFSMLNNVMGHLGYELYPAGWTKTPLLRYKTASVHHNMHHQRFHGNYALYFTWWDKWMGTEFQDYEARFEQIVTPNVEPSAASTPTMSSSYKQVTVTAQVLDQTYVFGADDRQSILQSALDQQIPLPYSCKSGRCGTCKMKCTEGTVIMKKNAILSNVELEAGYVLTCQSFPQTDKISLKK